MLFFNKKPQTRIHRLQQDLAEMEKLHNITPLIIRFIVKDKNATAPSKYDIEIRVTSIIDISPTGMPISHGQFTLEVNLPSGYPDYLPECKIKPAPFHPHFRRFTPLLGESYGIWIDPKGVDESLGSLVLRIIQSLRYEPRFIDTSARNIGNQNALNWYLSWQTFFQDPKSWFPSDKVYLPDNTSVTPKKFDIEPKTFNVAENHPKKQKSDKFSVVTAPKTFQIVESTPPYLPSSVALPNLGKVEASNFRGSCKTHLLIIDDTAKLKIFEHISWGQRTTNNVVEQGGILLGRAFHDENKGVVYSVVEDAIAGDSATGTSASLEMDHATWKKMIDKVDLLLDSDSKGDLQIVGWYHTHPNSLDVFMSGTDKGTQARFFSNEWQFAIVLNPHKMIWRAFHGRDAEECRGFFVAKV